MATLKIELTGTGVPEDLPCIYRLQFGTRFFIWKAKSIRQSLETVSNDLDRKIRLGFKPDDLFRELVAFLVRFEVRQGSAVILVSSADPEELIRSERKLLREFSQDPNCCNWNLDPYIPAWCKVNSTEALQSPIVTNTPVYTANTEKVPQIEEKATHFKNSTPANIPEELEMPEFTEQEISDFINARRSR